MTRTSMFWLAAAATFLAMRPAVGQETTAAPAKDFSTIHAMMCKKEKWETVAWKTDFRDVHAASMKEGKPIFIWAMDGQTLGCT